MQQKIPDPKTQLPAVASMFTKSSPFLVLVTARPLEPSTSLPGRYSAHPSGRSISVPCPAGVTLLVVSRAGWDAGMGWLGWAKGGKLVTLP